MEEIMEILMEILQGLHPDVDFSTETNLIDKGIIDSFDIVTIISEVADRFDVRITAGEIVPENFNSAKALSAFVDKKIKESED